VQPQQLALPDKAEMSVLNLRQSLFLIMATVMAFLLILANYVVTRETLNGALRLEEHVVEEHVQRVMSTLEAELSELVALNRMWSERESFRTIVDQPGGTPDIDPSVATAAGLSRGLAFVAIINPQGTIVHSCSFARGGVSREGLPERLRKALLPQTPLAAHANRGSGHHGLLSLERQILLVASAPIRKPGEEQAANGALVIGTFLDPARLNELGTATLVQLDAGSRPRKLPAVEGSDRNAGHTRRQDLLLDRSDPATITGIWMLENVYGHPAISLRVTTPRDIHQQALATCRHIRKWLAFTGLLVVMIMLLLVNWHVVIPLNGAISALRRGVDGVAEKAALTARIPFCGSRELDELVAATNDMLETLEQTQRDGEEHRQALIRADRLVSLGTLVSGVAHEINNPNNTILLSAETLEEILLQARTRLDELDGSDSMTIAQRPVGEIGEDAQSLLTGIIGSARRITRLVGELKGFSRKEALEKPASVDLNDVVQGAVTLMGHAAKKVSHHFTVSCAESLPPVSGSPQRLEQVTVNLLQNAAQALTAPSQGIEIGTAANGDGTVSFWIRDEGRGIAAEDLPHIRDPFFTTRREEGGTGLGLAISATIVMEHRGNIDIESTPGQGTRVLVTLPVESGPSNAC
jgi:signal transduction histidine kinase